jgi:Methylase involved in ubiquinone/menaquinone biosynthesis
MSWELEWDNIYKTQGEVQQGVLPTAAAAVNLFKSENIKTVLDLGCGMGRHSIFFAEADFKVTASDISPEAVQTTKQKSDKLNLDINVACHDIRKIPFADNSFDAVFCIWTSGHGTHADMIEHAREMLRVTKAGGIVFVDYVSKEDALFGVGREIEKDTFLDNVPGEETIPHHYSDEDEIREVYDGHELKIRPFTYHLDDSHQIKAFTVICRK